MSATTLCVKIKGNGVLGSGQQKFETFLLITKMNIMSYLCCLEYDFIYLFQKTLIHNSLQILGMLE